MQKPSVSEAYAIFAAILLLALALLNIPLVTLIASVAGLIVGISLAMKPTPSDETVVVGSLRRAGVIATAGFAAAAALSVVALLRA